MSWHNKKSKPNAQGTGTPYTPHKQPIKDLGKETKVQKEARNILPTENVWDFYTKQRPISFQYYSRMLGLPFASTAAFPDELATFRVDDLDENKSLVINHFAAYVSYRPDGTVGGPQENYRVSLEGPALAFTPNTNFGFNLKSETGALYDASGNGAFFIVTAATQGFTFLNQNVLNNGNSDTSLYIFESGEIQVDYKFITAGALQTFFPGNFTTLEYQAYINFDIRGHLINRTDANLLRELILNRQ